MEESYLKAYPEERRCRAFLEFCEQGDVEAIVNCLHYVDDDSESENVNDLNKEIDILRYRDNLGTLGSGLHFAIGNNRIEVVWLLLYLASNLEFSQFPADVLLALQRIGLERENPTGKTDIRSLKDGEGLTAGQRAMRLGGIWVPWIESGRLMV